MPYLAESTDTAAAVKYVLQNSFTSQEGDRDGIRDILVIVTDGLSNNKTQTLNIAKNLSSTNIRTLAIGVGYQFDKEELIALASDDKDVYNVTSYEALSTLQQELTITACSVDGGWGAWTNWTTCTVTCGGGTQYSERFCNNPAPAYGGKACVGHPREIRSCNTNPCPQVIDCVSKPADIVFLLDSSGSIGNDSFETQRQFVSQYVNAFPIGPDNVQIGVVIYSDFPQLVFNLNNFTDNATLIENINKIPYTRGTTNTAGAIQFVLDNSFIPSAGDRDDVGNVLIVITDGQSNNKTETLFMADRLRRSNLTVFAVGVGAGADFEELKAIATNNQYVFNVTTYDALSELQYELARAACIVNQPVTYISTYLQAMVTVVDNIQYNGKKHSLQIDLTNTGPYSLDLGNLSAKIYFNSFHLLEPDHISPKGSYVLPGQGIKVTHVKGTLFSLEPTDSLTAIGPNETVSINILAKGSAVSKSDIPPNWYVAIENYKPAVLQSTKPGKQFVSNFVTPAQWKRNRNDTYNPPTPEERFEHYTVSTPSGDEKTIIPTPEFIQIRKENIVEVHNFTIYATSEVEQEAKYLAAKLNFGEPQIVTRIPYQKSDSVLLWVDKSIHILESPEGYSLKVNSRSQSVSITGKGKTGVFYGIQSLLSLIEGPNGQNVSEVTIYDQPRSEYRGMEIDMSHNFHSKEEILKLIDAMGMYKMNKLHLHLTDDEGWRIEIPGLPELTEVGSQRCHDLSETVCLLPQHGSGPDNSTLGSGYLSVDDYKEIVQRAEGQHIEVIPELDIPGHSRAAIRAMESRFNRLKNSDLLEALRYRLVEPGDLSVYITPWLYTDNTMNPCIDSTYNFIDKVVTELKNMQPSLRMIHIGGDEIPSGAWTNSSSCHRLAETAMGFKDTKFVQEFFLERVSSLTQQKGLQLGAWQGILTDKYSKEVINRDKLSNAEVYAQVWNNVNSQKYAYDFANKRFKVIMSQASHFYFDTAQEASSEERGVYFASRFTDTQKTFSFMPENLYGTITENTDGKKITREELCADSKNCPALKLKKNIAGLEGCLWSETLYEEKDFDYMVYPRLLALAERAWYHAEWEDIDDVVRRKEEMNKDWDGFAKAVGSKELRRLETRGINYRIAPPGARLDSFHSFFLELFSFL
ncbi:hypothetical protein FSP39_006235 [Pinctada imbricata]|uniref:beta-N-acetylhexosaminidase n=1 Tax=Pinctada imbricata TaxID=66713 RepID=A0AA88YHY4_PINIB|nr:hypothetical protein FSP39_006235 [Pinctada imbricata]